MPELSSRSEEKATQDFYESNARAYFDTTVRVDMSRLYERFLPHVPAHGRILDAGSGSGRDTLAFLEQGYEVNAFDASLTLCALSTQLTGVKARVLRFQDFESPPLYDGIWACASFLHLHACDLLDAVRRLIGALKLGGALYISFKYGSGERISDDGRFYLDLDEPTMRRIFSEIPQIVLADVWISKGENPHQERVEWLNAIALKAADRAQQ